MRYGLLLKGILQRRWVLKQGTTSCWGTCFSGKHSGISIRLPGCTAQMSTNHDYERGGVSEIRHQKRLMRKEVKKILAQLTNQEMEEQSRHVASRVLDELRILDSIESMTLFISCPKLKEVDTSLILKRALESSSPEKKVYLPRVLDSDSNMHFLRTRLGDTYDVVPPFGIQEPTLCTPDGSKREDVVESETPLDVIFMPGLGFSTQGERLGRGGGYYDSFIEKYMIHAKEKGWNTKPLLVGLAFDEQIVQRPIPTDSHDQLVDLIITPSTVYTCT